MRRLGVCCSSTGRLKFLQAGCILACTSVLSGWSLRLAAFLGPLGLWMDAVPVVLARSVYPQAYYVNSHGLGELATVLTDLSTCNV